MPDRIAPQIPLEFQRLEASDSLQRSEAFYAMLRTRRTCRDFAADPVPVEVIEQCLLTAGTAPSGANRQPWHFAVVGNPETKTLIRQQAEAEEREFYQRRAPTDWLDALAPLGTDEHKPFLELAPYLIVVFAQKFARDDKGQKLKNYYVTESVGIATGMLLTALHQAGLATLTHTPSPMKFLNEILKRPDTEKPLMIIVTGYPTASATVPDIQRKDLAEIASFHL